MANEATFLPDAQEEVKQRYEFARHLFQLLVTWFTVFVGINTGVLGWIASAVLKGEKPPLPPVVLLSVLLSVQNGLGIAACLFVGKEMVRHRNRVSVLIQKSDWVAFPSRMYLQACWLMGTTCMSYAVAWILMPIVCS